MEMDDLVILSRPCWIQWNHARIILTEERKTHVHQKIVFLSVAKSVPPFAFSYRLSFESQFVRPTFLAGLSLTLAIILGDQFQFCFFIFMMKMLLYFLYTHESITRYSYVRESC